MKFHRLFYIGAMLLALTSCKKDEDTSVTPSLNGALRIEGLKEFIKPEQTLTMKPVGASHPDGKELGYAWKVSPDMEKYDTTRYTNGLNKDGKESDGTFIHKFSDELKTYTVYCMAFASGYSALSTVGYTTVVEGGKDGSIKGIDFPTESITSTDGTYYYKTIGTQTWMVNNVCETAKGAPFRNAEAMSDVFGRYYTYDEAVKVCEALEGGNKWELPSKEDWEILEGYIKSDIIDDNTKSVAAALMADATFNGTEMWEFWPEVGDITNASGFSAIPAGYANIAAKDFTGAYEYSVFWTATENPSDSNQAYCRYIFCDQPDTFCGSADKKSFGASVRCIKK